MQPPLVDPWVATISEPAEPRPPLHIGSSGAAACRQHHAAVLPQQAQHLPAVGPVQCQRAGRERRRRRTRDREEALQGGRPLRLLIATDVRHEAPQLQAGPERGRQGLQEIPVL